MAFSPTLITPDTRDLGDGFLVRRALPAPARRSVGPFVFFDEFGPADFGPGQGLDVRAHPHIGLATVTYVFSGVIEHRDGLGTVQRIRPGDVNWMTAGRGIVHTERSPHPREGGPLHGVQFWVGLPTAHESTPPAFHHHPASALPRFAEGGVEGVVILGEALGLASPVATFSPTLFLDLKLAPGGRVAAPDGIGEVAVYVIEGEASVGGTVVTAGTMAVAGSGAPLSVQAGASPARAIMFGGAPLDGDRRLWWNFVASDAALIEAAKSDWAAGPAGAARFPMPPGETERIPLPPK